MSDLVTPSAVPSPATPVCGVGGVGADADAARHAATAEGLRRASEAWRHVPLWRRLRVVRRARRLAARGALPLALSLGGRRPLADTVAAEILPLLEAARFLEREAPAILAPRRHGARGRPLWLAGLRAASRRVPFGAVLVLGPANYPLFLPCAQALQALVAGNGVLIKPGLGGAAPALRFAALLRAAGLPEGLLAVAGESEREGRALVAAGFDRIVLTGSAATGRAVLGAAARALVPCTAELSGADAMFVLPGADLALAARAILYGLRLNGGATCIAPRRVFVPRTLAASLEAHLARGLPALAGMPPPGPAAAEALVSVARATVAAGGRTVGAVPGGIAATVRQGRPVVLADVPPVASLLGAAGIGRDLFASWVALVPVATPEEALRLDRACSHALGASVFGPTRAARRFARRLRAGSVTVNDVVAPTADPRLGFGGAGESGFGTTRGREGLLEMTRLQTVSARGPLAFRPHLAPPRDGDAARLATLVAVLHGGLGGAVAALRGRAGRETPR